MIDGWSPSIGDPTGLGWATTGAYVLAMWLCARAHVTTPAEREAEPTRARRFWSALAVAMAVLAINKQLDLQSLLTAIGRQMAHDEGWYDARRIVQRGFIIAVALSAVAMLALVLLYLRRATVGARLAGVGLTFLVAFVVTRAASFHHVDAVIDAGWAGVHVNHVLELGGIAIIVLGAAGDRRRQIRLWICRQL